MIPFIIIGGVITAILLDALSKETEKTISEFSDKDVITDYAKLFTPKDETKAKIHTTRTINKLIKNIKLFKIGKSGDPKTRHKSYTKLQKMYIIVESENKDFISKLESIYNEKFISNKKNKNCNVGSAGDMTDKIGRYFLYFIAK